MNYNKKIKNQSKIKNRGQTLLGLIVRSMPLTMNEKGLVCLDIEHLI